MPGGLPGGVGMGGFGIDRYIGAVIGSRQFKDQYCREKVLGWKGELEALSEIARSQPHAAYTVFTKSYKSKFTYFMRTIESFEDYVDPIQEVIDELLLPTLFGQTEPLPSNLRQLVTFVMPKVFPLCSCHALATFSIKPVLTSFILIIYRENASTIFIHRFKIISFISCLL